MESGSSDGGQKWGVMKGVLKKLQRRQSKLQGLEKSNSIREKSRYSIKEAAAEQSKGPDETIVQTPLSEAIQDTSFGVNPDELQRDVKREMESSELNRGGERETESQSGSNSAEQQWGVLTNVLKFQRNIKQLHRNRSMPKDIEEDCQILRTFGDSLEEAAESSRGHNETIEQMPLSEEIHNDGLISIHHDEQEREEGERENCFIGSVNFIITVISKCIPIDFTKKKVVTHDGYEPVPHGPELA